jgi:hypothetical protein
MAVVGSDIAMSRMGRPSKLCPEVQDRIVMALRLGHFQKAAAAYGGISERTLIDWLARGAAEEKGPYADLYNQVQSAKQEAEMRALGAIQKAAQHGNWRAAAWLLQHLNPSRFCTRTRLAEREEEKEDLESLGDEDLARTALDVVRRILVMGLVSPDEVLEALGLEMGDRGARAGLIPSAARSAPGR